MSSPKVQQKGFTLVEVLIAVGAVSLIAIGLARVFSATGETVRAGRRLSNLNEYASLIERTEPIVRAFNARAPAGVLAREPESPGPAIGA